MENRRKYPKLSAAFSLVEVPIVLAIIVLVAFLVAGIVGSFYGYSKEREAEIFVREKLSAPLTAFRLSVGRYPTTQEGLGALLKAPDSIKKLWNGPYIDDVPNDPWGNPYRYESSPEGGGGNYKLWSLGADGIPSLDDIF